MTAMPLKLSNLVAALRQFPAYHAIDVFADDLAELRAGSLPASFRRLDADGRKYAVTEGGESFALDVFPQQGVVRLSKPGPAAGQGALHGAIMGGLVGTAVGSAIDAAGQQKGDGMLGGLLLGLLVGASLGVSAGDARRVFALRYDRQSNAWRAYDGGLLRWMKEQLIVHA